ncbi:MAG: hypothetical protein DRI79_04485 [Chloroflexi bacterium]|nr:MAG: hypothetical protein DRI79_04485 [Chloroflexota bacterium]
MLAGEEGRDLPPLALAALGVFAVVGDETGVERALKQVPNVVFGEATGREATGAAFGAKVNHGPIW